MPDDPLLAALRRKLAAYKGARRDDLAARVEERIRELESVTEVQLEPEPEPGPEDRPDGVHGVGGGWHELVIGGEVIDKVRGAEAAQEAYEAYQQSEPDEGD